MSEKLRLILLTGMPGVGKTTLVQKCCQELSENHKVICKGFYTEEIRDPSTKERVGFDVVTLEQKRAPLARSGSKGRGPNVGKYQVHVQDFEDLVLPILKPTNNCLQLLVIDEIGKMELKSTSFEAAVYSCLGTSTIILATLPQMKQPLPLIDRLMSHRQAKVITVTKANRSCLQRNVVDNILKMISEN